MTKFIQKFRNFGWSNLIQLHVCDQFHLRIIFHQFNILHHQYYLLFDPLIKFFSSPTFLTSFFLLFHVCLFLSPSPWYFLHAKRAHPKKVSYKRLQSLHLTMYKSCHGLFLQIPKQFKSRMVQVHRFLKIFMRLDNPCQVG